MTYWPLPQILEGKQTLIVTVDLLHLLTSYSVIKSILSLMVKCCHLVPGILESQYPDRLNREFNSMAYFTVNPSLQRTATRKYLSDFHALLLSEFFIALVKNYPLFYFPAKALPGTMVK